MSKIICNVSDGANNQYGSNGGFYAFIRKEQQLAIGAAIMSKVHCINHEWDLFQDTIELNELLKKLAEIIEFSRKYMNKNYV